MLHAPTGRAAESREDAAARAAGCPVCEISTASLLLRGRDRLTGAPGEFAVMGCEACRLAFTSPHRSDEEFDLYYPPAYVDHRADQREGSRISRAHWRGVVRWGPYRTLARMRPGLLLDVGCGRGSLSRAFRELGWRTCGVEPDPEAAAGAEGPEMKVHQGGLEEAPWVDGSFDAVVFNHSLEHVPDPLQALKRARALLRPGGLVAISVPNFGCWQRRLFGADWYQLDLPRHLQHFDRATLASLTERAGFKVECIGTTPMRAGLPNSIQYRLWGRVRLDGRRYRASLWFLLPLLRPLDLFAQGDCLYLVARP